MILESGNVSAITAINSNSLVDHFKKWQPGIFNNKMLRITSGLGVGQVYAIRFNNSNSLVINGTWNHALDPTSTYEILDVITNALDEFEWDVIKGTMTGDGAQWGEVVVLPMDATVVKSVAIAYNPIRHGLIDGMIGGDFFILANVRFNPAGGGNMDVRWGIEARNLNTRLAWREIMPLRTITVARGAYNYDSASGNIITDVNLNAIPLELRFFGGQDGTAATTIELGNLTILRGMFAPGV